MQDSKSRPATGEKFAADGWTAAFVTALVAFACRLPALGAWWNQDDWGLLGRAAGIAPQPAIPARWLTQTAYWRILWPVAGLDPAPYAFTRLGLHALAVAGLVRLAARLGLGRLQQWVAGLVLAASPLAFGPLYWAAGIQDLAAVTLMVWALERWLAPGRLARPAAAALAVGALAAKETVIGLPVLLAILLVRDSTARRDRTAWLLIAGMTLAAAAAAVLALRSFSTGPDDPYALAGPLAGLGRLLVYGWWLILPGPSYPTVLGLGMGLGGALVWLAWGGWGARRWRRGDRTPAFTLAGALLVLAPLLPLARHVAPDLAFPVEPFGCLALAALVPGRWRPRAVVVGALVAAAAAWGLFGMLARLGLRDATGLPADPLVRRTAVSAEACRQLARWPVPAAGLVFVQPPLTGATAAMAAELGENWVTGSVVYHGLGGTLGPRLVLGPEVPVVWANGLRETPEGAFVLLDAGGVIKPWGLTDQALLYQTLTDVGLGLYDRARAHLLRASLVSGQTLSVFFDPQLLPIRLERVLANEEAFYRHLAAGRRPGSGSRVDDGLQTNFRRLLDACAGRQ
ncbi:MAG TPA: hypothetical protein PLL30_03530 [Candidatus Krumholzibacteria bacterium]|nr:hypothetical protein [Candidatus Krumholzibacteria bacterium]HPD70844.1 hypothetical protein [Candidatus Krumholzibacteria bacterium]HRY39456.1 hypothetical protein [Candidatus Krumholzibacteria bacterium]